MHRSNQGMRVGANVSGVLANRLLRSAAPSAVTGRTGVNRSAYRGLFNMVARHRALAEPIGAQRGTSDEGKRPRRSVALGPAWAEPDAGSEAGSNQDAPGQAVCNGPGARRRGAAAGGAVQRRSDGAARPAFGHRRPVDAGTGAGAVAGAPRRQPASAGRDLPPADRGGYGQAARHPGRGVAAGQCLPRCRADPHRQATPAQGL